jgi:hypothetical protein
MKPHLIQIMSYEHCGFAMSCIGDPNVMMPNLKPLAAGGMRYGRAYPNCAACNPSRAECYLPTSAGNIDLHIVTQEPAMEGADQGDPVETLSSRPFHIMTKQIESRSTILRRIEGGQVERRQSNPNLQGAHGRIS